MDSFRKASKALLAKSKKKKSTLADLKAGFERMFECVSAPPVVSAPVEVVQSPPPPPLQEVVISVPVQEVVAPAPRG